MNNKKQLQAGTRSCYGGEEMDPLTVTATCAILTFVFTVVFGILNLKK